jgi:hypothetical protein
VSDGGQDEHFRMLPQMTASLYLALSLGHRVFVSAICNAGWSCALFASYSQWIVGPFAMIVSQEPCVFAMIVG